MKLKKILFAGAKRQARVEQIQKLGNQRSDREPFG